MGVMGIGYYMRCTYPNLIDDTASTLLYPFLKVHSWTIEPLKYWYAHRTMIQHLEDQLSRERMQKELLLAENIELKSARSFKRYALNGTIAHILYRKITDQEHIIVVDKGSREGIVKDMVAIHNNCLIGRVDHVYPWYSQIRLITDKTCKVAAYCAKTGAKGIHQGCNKAADCDLAHVSHLETVEPEDMVLSSGAGLVFPQGFALGKVKTFQTDDLQHKITVEPLVSIDQIDYCLLTAKGATA
jgi:rod shape-determining protein MreC